MMRNTIDLPVRLLNGEKTHKSESFGLLLAIFIQICFQINLSCADSSGFAVCWGAGDAD